MLHTKSLREFLGSQPPPQRPAPLDHPPFTWQSPIASNPPTDTPIDSVGAREVAEYVSGFREQTVNVYQTDGGGGLEPTLTPIGDGPPLFTAWTRKVRPERPEVTVTLTVTTTILGVKMTDTRELSAIGGRESNVPDSVFWTDGAIEMLVLPYYASVEGHGAPWYLALILGKWSGVIPTSTLDAVLLLAQIVEKLAKALLEHPAGAVERLVERLEGETEPAPAGPFDSDVYALVHLPNSEWIDQTELIITSIFLEHRTWLLASDGDHPLVSPTRRLVPRRRVTA